MEIGLAKINITPSLGTPFVGQLFQYHAKGVESNLFATSMFIEDGKFMAMFIACDILMLTNELACELRQKISDTVQISVENIILTTTHTHSGPSVMSVLGSTEDKSYVNYFKNKVIESAFQAHNNITAAELCFACGEIDDIAFNRRYLMSDGTISTHPPKCDPHIVRPEGPNSTFLGVLLAKSKRGNVLGAIVVFGCHATVMERSNEYVSSDFPGKTTEYISKEFGDVPVLFMQGPCGNVCQVNPLDPNSKELGPTWAKHMGETIGAKSISLLGSSSLNCSGTFRLFTETIELPRRNIDNDLINWASKHKDLEANLPELSDYGVEMFGYIKPKFSLDEFFKTSYWAKFYANEINTLERLRMEQPEMPLTIKIITQDNWAMVTVPCELFVEWGDLIRKQSPFEHTFVVELANGWNGYIPTKLAFERKGGYETKEVTSTMLIPEAGDILFNKVMEMLQKARIRMS